MADNELNTVTDGEESGVASWDSPEATPENLEAQVMEKPTEAEPSGDAELKQMIEALRNDINRIKSSSQSREYETNVAYQAKIERLLQELENQRVQATLNDMPEEERRLAMLQAQYMAQLEQLKQAVEPLMNQHMAEQRKREAVKHFHELTGIPEAELMQHAETPEELQKFIKEQIAELRKQASRQPPQPPKVTTAPKAGGKTGILAKWDSMSEAEKSAILERARRDGIPLGEL